MSIAPTELPIAPQSPRFTLPIEERPWPIPQDPVQPPDVNDPSDGAESSRDSESPHGPQELSLTQVIGQLSKQLRSIEKTFITALQSLARDAEQNAQTQASQWSGRVHSTDSTDGGKQVGANGTASRANPYDGLIRRAAEAHELDPSLLRAVVRQESGFDPRARSSAGAMGLMQLMPETAKSLGVTDPYDPEQNVEGGAKLLRGLIDQYGGRLDFALAAYNAGSGAVAKYGGIPPYQETRDYVHSILSNYKANALGA